MCLYVCGVGVAHPSWLPAWPSHHSSFHLRSLYSCFLSTHQLNSISIPALRQFIERSLYHALWYTCALCRSLMVCSVIPCVNLTLCLPFIPCASRITLYPVICLPACQSSLTSLPGWLRFPSSALHHSLPSATTIPPHSPTILIPKRNLHFNYLFPCLSLLFGSLALIITP